MLPSQNMGGKIYTLFSRGRNQEMKMAELMCCQKHPSIAVGCIGFSIALVQHGCTACRSAVHILQNKFYFCMVRTGGNQLCCQ